MYIIGMNEIPKRGRLVIIIRAYKQPSHVAISIEQLHLKKEWEKHELGKQGPMEQAQATRVMELGALF